MTTLLQKLSLVSVDAEMRIHCYGLDRATVFFMCNPAI